MASFTSVIQTLMDSNSDFTGKLKERLMNESSNVKNHFKFIVELFSQEVLSNESTDPECDQLKNTIFDLAVKVACSKGSDAVGGLMKALEGSGNSELISSVRTWVEADFGIESGVDLSEQEAQSSLQPGTSRKLEEIVQNRMNLSSSCTKLIDEVMSNVEAGIMDQLERRIVAHAPNIINVEEFRSSLASINVLDESEEQLQTGPEAEEFAQWIQKTVQAAFSKKSFGSLLIALDYSGNASILDNISFWLSTMTQEIVLQESDVQAIALERFQKECNLLKSAFLEEHYPKDSLLRIGSFNYQTDNWRKALLAVKFDKEKMIACFGDGTLKIWNWMVPEEKTIKLGAKVKDDINSIQWDDEIIVLGTQTGSVHLFNAETHQEKSSIRFPKGCSSFSLQFVGSKLVVHTLGGPTEQFWWIDISRSDMKLRNERREASLPSAEHSGLFIDPIFSLLYTGNVVNVYGTESGRPIGEDHVLFAPADIVTMKVVDLVFNTRVVVAGCSNGMITYWNAAKLMETQTPVRTFQATEQEYIFCLCGFKGHLLSVDKSGKLLMWSGLDLERVNFDAPVPRARLLGDSFFNVTNLVAHDRWFASNAVDDGITNIFTLPESWIRNG